MLFSTLGGIWLVKSKDIYLRYPWHSSSFALPSPQETRRTPRTAVTMRRPWPWMSGLVAAVLPIVFPIRKPFAMFLVGYYSQLEAWLPWTIIVLQFTIYTLMIQLRKLTIETSYNFLSGQHPNPNWACNMSGSVPGRPIKAGNFIMTGVWCGQDSAPVWDNPKKADMFDGYWWCIRSINWWTYFVHERAWQRTKISLRSFRGKTNRLDLSKGDRCSKSKMKQLGHNLPAGKPLRNIRCLNTSENPTIIHSPLRGALAGTSPVWYWTWRTPMSCQRWTDVVFFSARFCLGGGKHVFHRVSSIKRNNYCTRVVNRGCWMIMFQ